MSRAAAALIDCRPGVVHFVTFYLSDTQDLLHKSSVMDDSPGGQMDKIRHLMKTVMPSLSSASLFLEMLFADTVFRVPVCPLAKLEEVEAFLCKNFDKMVTISNSVAADYHALVQGHATCEQEIKELTASGNSNNSSNQIQLLQNRKAQIEQAMVQMEDIQCLAWKGFQELQFFRK